MRLVGIWPIKSEKFALNITFDSFESLIVNFKLSMNFGKRRLGHRYEVLVAFFDEEVYLS